jgi:magnesium-transporting ATPase (P-type)
MVRSSSASPSDVGVVPWHARPAEEVLGELGASDGGLSAEGPRHRLDRHGPKPTAGGSETSALTLLLRQIRSPLMYALFQALCLLTCRSVTRPNREIGHWSNPAVYVGIGAVLVLQALFVFLPPMQDLFGAVRLDLTAIALATVGPLLVLPVTWLEERWRVRRVAGSYGREP